MSENILPNNKRAKILPPDSEDSGDSMDFTWNKKKRTNKSSSSVDYSSSTSNHLHVCNSNHPEPPEGFVFVSKTHLEHLEHVHSLYQKHLANGGISIQTQMEQRTRELNQIVGNDLSVEQLEQSWHALLDCSQQIDYLLGKNQLFGHRVPNYFKNIPRTFERLESISETIREQANLIVHGTSSSSTVPSIADSSSPSPPLAPSLWSSLSPTLSSPSSSISDLVEYNNTSEWAEFKKPMARIQKWIDTTKVNPNPSNPSSSSTRRIILRPLPPPVYTLLILSKNHHTKGDVLAQLKLTVANASQLPDLTSDRIRITRTGVAIDFPSKDDLKVYESGVRKDSALNKLCQIHFACYRLPVIEIPNVPIGILLHNLPRSIIQHTYYLNPGFGCEDYFVWSHESTQNWETDSKTRNVFFGIAPKLWQMLYQNDFWINFGTNVGNKVQATEIYLMKQCQNCWSFDHNTSKCTFPGVICPKCGLEYTKGALHSHICAISPTKCTNCVILKGKQPLTRIDHCANSLECPKYREMRSIAKRSTAHADDQISEKELQKCKNRKFGANGVEFVFTY